MKQKTLAIFMLSAVLTLTTGCGADNQGTAGSPQAATATLQTDSIESQVGENGGSTGISSQQEIYEDKLTAGTITAEECVALGELYGEAGESLKQRDIWEMAQILSYDNTFQEKLADVVTQVQDNPSAIQEMIALAVSDVQNGSADDLLGRIQSDEWKNTLLPNLLIGQRNYEMTSDSGTCKAMIQTDEYGDLYSAFWFCSPSGLVTYAASTPTSYKYFTAEFNGNVYDGAFQITTMDKVSGSIYEDSGTLHENICTGDLTERVSTSSDSLDNPITCWNNRGNLDYIEYEGNFTEDGHTSIKQESQVTSQSALMYAALEQSGNLLYVSLPLSEGETAATYTFTNETFGITTELLWE